MFVGQGLLSFLNRLQQERNLLDHVLEDREYGLTLMLDESSDQGADRAPLNIIIVLHRRVYFMDTLLHVCLFAIFRWLFGVCARMCV